MVIMKNVGRNRVKRNKLKNFWTSSRVILFHSALHSTFGAHCWKLSLLSATNNKSSFIVVANEKARSTIVTNGSASWAGGGKMLAALWWILADKLMMCFHRINQKVRKSVLIHHEIMSWFVSYVCCDESKILNLKISRAKCAKLPKYREINQI